MEDNKGIWPPSPNVSPPRRYKQTIRHEFGIVSLLGGVLGPVFGLCVEFSTIYSQNEYLCELLLFLFGFPVISILFGLASLRSWMSWVGIFFSVLTIGSVSFILWYFSQ